MAIVKYINFVNKKPKNVNKIKFCLSYCVLCVLVVCFLIYLSFLVLKKNLYNLDSYNSEKFTRVSLDLTQIPKIVLPDDNVLVEPKNRNCSYWDCFNVYRCGQKNSDKISIYVYPLKYYADTKGTRAYTMSKEFYIILKTIINSPYYTSNPNEACILIPSIDLMNLFNVDQDLVSKALAVLPHWNNGENHVLINMVAPNLEEFATANALVASAKLDTWSYRRGFDISMPFYSPHVYRINYKNILKHESDDRPFLLIASSSTMTVPQINIFHDIAFNQQKILFFKACGKNEYQTEYSTQKHLTEDGNYYCSYPAKDVYEYPNLLELGEFCLVTLDGNFNQMSLLEAMTSLCIPVIVNNIDMLPFAEIIDWKLAAITINEASLSSIYDILNGVTLDHRIDLRSHLKWLYEKYFNSLETIVHTMLDELNDRIQPHVAKNYLDWNLQPLPKSTKNPLFLPLIAPKSQGFTAVILTYDRVESLMTLVQKLAVVQSLQKIIIIWNNQKKSPPHLAMFQKISKPLKIIKTKENKLSNRFYPYEEIETEAILTIDDDIIMLTADELDFGYEVWREFPDRIVGFPSRIHVWDNTTNTWTYESEWTNQISMVLTGAAFHHKFWSYMYTNSMPGNIKEWVDEKMNCEDIAMNFLVANITNKPPIKVAPRKKFKCPECTNSEMLSADLNHMKERSACIDRFSKIYGNMPLKTVEFRADPVLYKDNFPEKLKRFNDIGSL